MWTCTKSYLGAMLDDMDKQARKNVWTTQISMQRCNQHKEITQDGKKKDNKHNGGKTCYHTQG